MVHKIKSPKKIILRGEDRRHTSAISAQVIRARTAGFHLQTFFHPDYTVGSGVPPDLQRASVTLVAVLLAGFTADRE